MDSPQPSEQTVEFITLHDGGRTEKNTQFNVRLWTQEEIKTMTQPNINTTQTSKTKWEREKKNSQLKSGRLDLIFVQRSVMFLSRDIR